jgi:hypothetical protein
MSIEEKVMALTQTVERLKEKKLRNQIARENILKELKEKHGLNSIAEAKRALAELGKELEQRTEKLESDYEQFTAKYGEKLGIN